MKIRIEIHLDSFIAKLISKKAKAEGRSRKNYIEMVCIKDASIQPEHEKNAKGIPTGQTMPKVSKWAKQPNQ